MNKHDTSAAEALAAAGLAAEDAKSWQKIEPVEFTDFGTDCRNFSNFWKHSSRLLARLPKPAAQQNGERNAARLIQESAHRACGFCANTRTRFTTCDKPVAPCGWKN